METSFLHFVELKWEMCVRVCFQRELATIPVRYVHHDFPTSEAYTLHSVGKHGFGESVRCCCFYTHSI